MKNLIKKVSISAQDLTNTVFESIVRQAKKENCRTIEFIYEPLIGPYLIVNVEAAIWELDNFQTKRLQIKQMIRKR